MLGGLMQLVAYGAQHINISMVVYRYYDQIDALFQHNFTDIVIRNKDDSINIEYTEKVNNIINIIRKKYCKISLDTMRHIIILYVAYTIDNHHYVNVHNNTLFYLIKIKDKDIMNYIKKNPLFIRNKKYPLALGCPDFHDYNKHFDNNIKRIQYNYNNFEEEYESDDE